MSTPAELQAAIDGNRREGRRSGYSSYVNAGENVVQRMSQTPSSMALRQQMSPLSLVTAVAGGQHHGPQTLVNGSAVHTPLSHHSHHQQGPMGQPAGEQIFFNLVPQRLYLAQLIIRAQHSRE